MKKLLIILCLSALTLPVLGQQILWTTLDDSSSKYITVDNVIGEVLDLYDFYEYYYDGSGYSKDGFFSKFESYVDSKGQDVSFWKDFKQTVTAIDSLSVIAFKTNSGYGSEVIVMCINNKKVDMVAFTGSYERGAKTTYKSDKDKFEKWFKTLLH